MACENEFEAVLEQLSDDNNRHPLAYASRATNEAEKKSPPVKLEMQQLYFLMNYFTWPQDNYFYGSSSPSIQIFVLPKSI